MAARPTLTFLLDTNVVIALEPYAGSIEQLQGLLAELVQAAHVHGHRVVVHPANFDDLNETRDSSHRAQNLAALNKYERIVEPPVDEELLMLAGESAAGGNDSRDLRLLAAVKAGAATHLITQDTRLLRRADRSGLGEQVITGKQALELLRQLHPLDPPTPPTVELTEASLLDLQQDIFESLKDDYPEFEQWIRKVAADGAARRTWVVKAADGRYRAIAIVKLDDDHPLLPGERATKLSTFKVHAESEGEKLGELLLKTVLMWAHEVHVDRLFVTVLNDESKQGLLYFLELFGFEEQGALPSRASELVYLKVLRPRQNGLDPLEFHMRHGPPAISGTGELYVVPVIPRWYEGLFPDAPSVGSFHQAPLGGLLIETQPFGNALRKAYLSNTNTKELPPGSTILFYRSAGAGGKGAVHAVGVVERTLRSSKPEDVLAFVGRRTVYSADDVAALCDDGHGGRREVLAVLFRQDRFLAEPWTLPQLIESGVLNGPPQTINKVKDQGGIEWVNRQLAG